MPEPRVIVLAGTVHRGRRFLAHRPALHPAVVVTPRTSDAARGLSVEHVTVTRCWKALPTWRRLATLRVVQPALYAGGCSWCRKRIATTIAELEDELRGTAQSWRV